ncbi:hypothetical protein XENOCAPTIV_025497 [Xenoophorus captivus]|uniref:Uncharacterized protein n=1 Tax=Xenoophorus captivus TaxID=1517983 RepID=A0ABV0RV92_9TELE
MFGFLLDEPSVDCKLDEKRKVSSGTLTPRFAVQKDSRDHTRPKSPQVVSKADEVSGQNLNPTPATGVAKPVPRPPTQQAPCTAEIKTIGAFPPLMRAVSWDAVGSINSRTGAPGFPPTVDEVFSDKSRDGVFKSSLYTDLQAQPGSIQKLSKLREHKLMRNQSIVGFKLPDLSEAAERDKGRRDSQRFPVEKMQTFVTLLCFGYSSSPCSLRDVSGSGLSEVVYFLPALASVGSTVPTDHTTLQQSRNSWSSSAGFTQTQGKRRCGA